MLYLDYAKPLADGKYILNFFADSVADLESISHGQKFVTKNGTDYGVPQPGSTVVVTSPNSGKTTYVMDAEGIWVVTEDISYSAVVANPSDEATAKLEKLKVNNTTYAAGGGKLYMHQIQLKSGGADYGEVMILTSRKDKININEITNQNHYLVLNYQRTDNNKRYSVIGGDMTEDHGSKAIFGKIIIQEATDSTNATLSFGSFETFDEFGNYWINEL